MASDVVVPEVGEVGMDLTFAGWLKQEGDAVTTGEPLFELNTDKVTLAVEAYVDGTLVDLRAVAGEVVVPHMVVATILAPGEVRASDGDAVLRTPAEAPSPGTADSSAVPGVSVPRGSSPGGASPKARRLAGEAGLDLASVQGSGPEGLITERDVQALIEMTTGA